MQRIRRVVLTIVALILLAWPSTGPRAQATASEIAAAERTMLLGFQLWDIGFFDNNVERLIDKHLANIDDNLTIFEGIESLNLMYEGRDNSPNVVSFSAGFSNLGDTRLAFGLKGQFDWILDGGFLSPLTELDESLTRFSANRLSLGAELRIAGAVTVSYSSISFIQDIFGDGYYTFAPPFELDSLSYEKWSFGVGRLDRLASDLLKRPGAAELRESISRISFISDLLRNEADGILFAKHSLYTGIPMLPLFSAISYSANDDLLINGSVMLPLWIAGLYGEIGYSTAERSIYQATAFIDFMGANTIGKNGRVTYYTNMFKASDADTSAYALFGPFVSYRSYDICKNASLYPFDENAMFPEGLSTGLSALLFKVFSDAAVELHVFIDAGYLLKKVFPDDAFIQANCADSAIFQIRLKGGGVPDFAKR